MTQPDQTPAPSGHTQVKKIAHLGIAVRDLDASLAFYRDRLGLEHIGTTEMVEGGMKIAFLRAGEALIELLAPLHDDSEVSRFLAKRGEGIHHLCLEVTDLQGSLDELGEGGIRRINSTPRIGAEGFPVAFLHPKSCNGVLLELLEEKQP